MRIPIVERTICRTSKTARHLHVPRTISSASTNRSVFLLNTYAIVSPIVPMDQMSRIARTTGGKSTPAAQCHATAASIRTHFIATELAFRHAGSVMAKRIVLTAVTSATVPVSVDSLYVKTAIVCEASLFAMELIIVATTPTKMFRARNLPTTRPATVLFSRLTQRKTIQMELIYRGSLMKAAINPILATTAAWDLQLIIISGISDALLICRTSVKANLVMPTIVYRESGVSYFVSLSKSAFGRVDVLSRLICLGLFSVVCDGTADCIDASDEQNCGTSLLQKPTKKFKFGKRNICLLYVVQELRSFWVETMLSLLR